MKIYFLCIIFVFVMMMAGTAVAAADNNISVLKPVLAAGSYGTGNGQIDTPVCVRVDADDNIYILQHVYKNSASFKSFITVYDRNLALVRSFPVLKKSMSDVGWEKASGEYYYDNLASSFDFGKDGLIYILCGWDVIAMDPSGDYVNQFPVQSYMTWIDKSGGVTNFYYPHGLTVTNDGYVAITSGDSPSKHEIILINTDGRLFRKIQAPVNIQDIARDRNGTIYVTATGSNVVRVYDPTLAKEKDLALDFNGTYKGAPSALALFSGGNMTASANGIFVYGNDGKKIAQFMDNNLSANNKSWGRPMATNSTDWLIVVSGRADADKTPQPIILYNYGSWDKINKDNVVISGGDMLWIVLGGGLIIIMAIVWIVGVIFFIRK